MSLKNKLQELGKTISLEIDNQEEYNNLITDNDF